MDAFLTFCVILGSLSIHQVTGLLHCIECTHIVWNQLNKTRYESVEGPNAPWIVSISQMLNVRFSPACAADNPETWTPQSDPNYQVGGAYPQAIAPSEAVCPAFTKTEKCNLMYGQVHVYLSQYDKAIHLDMYIRNCASAEGLEDTCYERNTIRGQFSKIRNDFQNAVSFLGRGTHVNLFYGRQCYCSSNRCAAFTQGGTSVTVSVMTMLAAMVAYFVLKV